MARLFHSMLRLSCPWCLYLNVIHSQMLVILLMFNFIFCFYFPSQHLGVQLRPAINDIECCSYFTNGKLKAFGKNPWKLKSRLFLVSVVLTVPSSFCRFNFLFQATGIKQSAKENHFVQPQLVISRYNYRAECSASSFPDNLRFRLAVSLY